MATKKWEGTWPADCDLCDKPLADQLYFVDGRIKEGIYAGRWALMCPNCFRRYGSDIGTGKGQMYDPKTLEKMGG